MSKPTVAALTIRLCRAACDLDETVQQIADEHLNPGEAALLAAPLTHLDLAVSRLELVVFETEKLDQRHRMAA